MISNNIIIHVLNTYWTEYMYKLCIYATKPYYDYKTQKYEKSFYYCEIIENLTDIRKKDKKLDEFLNSLENCNGKPGHYKFKNQNYGEQAFLMSKKIYDIELKKYLIDMDF